MKILFVSHGASQSVITVSLYYDVNGFETHLYNHDGGHTEMWSVSSSFEQAAHMHKKLCEKCYIKVNM